MTETSATGRDGGELRRAEAGVLDVAYLHYGRLDDPAVVLLHGFPYDVHAYDEVAPLLAAAGRRVVVPYLRGYGPTRFLSDATPRSGQQASLAHDLLALLDTLDIDRAVLAGYDWGGRAACIVAALWPERVRGLVSGNGYNLQNIAASLEPALPEDERRFWYQYYFHGERGRAGLSRYRDELCRLLWRQWSPNWQFDEATYRRTAASFRNPDFVDVVVHSYRHRYALVDGDPAAEDTERRLLAQPVIDVPTIALDGADNGVIPADGGQSHERHFGSRYRRRVLPDIGHNIPQETPRTFAEAVLDVAPD